jgi:cell division protein FtsQ
LFATILCFYLLWRTGEWALNRLIYENDAFAVATVEVQTDGVIAPDQIRRWAAIKPGANLMALDLQRVRRDLELVPAIGAVAVERVLPQTLRIRVTEREPIAQVHLPRARTGGGLDVVVLQLDATGHVMTPLDPRQRSTPVAKYEELLPILTGVNAAELQVGRQVESPQLLSALEMIAKFQESSLAALADLKRVDLTAAEVLEVTTEQGAAVTLGLKDFERQFARWREAHQEGMRYGKSIAWLDLAVSNNVPARWMEASLESRSVPPRKSAKPSRTTTTRRRNA